MPRKAGPDIEEKAAGKKGNAPKQAKEQSIAGLMEALRLSAEGERAQKKKKGRQAEPKPQRGSRQSPALRLLRRGRAFALRVAASAYFCSILFARAKSRGALRQEASRPETALSL
jgi:hypothetical protein